MRNVSNRHERDDRRHRRGRVVVCLANRLLAESLATALAHRGWTIEAVGTTETDALRQVPLYTPDVCVISGVFAHSSGIPLASAIARTAPHTRAVIMGTVGDPATRAKARTARIAAVLTEDQPINVVDDVLGRVVRGEELIDTATVVPLYRRAGARQVHYEAERLAPLTSREREVLALLADGHTTTAMADALGVSAATVRSHIQSVFTKLGVHTRLRAAAIYRASGSKSEVQAV
jgi:two-component system, NarL family, nitrate/nitrite response regulator NarL